MINKKIEKAINDQINAELYSSYLYLSMASDVEEKSLAGFGHWMKCQAQEELMHAMKMYDYIVERGGRVTMKAIAGPETKWKTPLAMVEQVYKHEQHVTALINAIMDLAIKEKDHATVNFLQWFVKEQVEEESSADEILQKLKLIGGKGDGLFMIDKDLATRIPLFTFPLPTAQA